MRVGWIPETESIKGVWGKFPRLRALWECGVGWIPETQSIMGVWDRVNSQDTEHYGSVGQGEFPRQSALWECGGHFKCLALSSSETACLLMWKLHKNFVWVRRGRYISGCSGHHYRHVPGRDDHIQTWAADNNLKLNRNKTKEIIFSSRREGAPPPSCPNIERVTSLRVLGVIVNDKLTAADHVTMLLSSCSSLLYVTRVLRSHGMPTTSLHDIFRAIVVSRIQYAAPAWSGMSSATVESRKTNLTWVKTSNRIYPYCWFLFGSQTI